MEENKATWLKAMQNGALGEARGKAFLMERFWILERSVDIEGADFIIQRRLSQRSLLDSAPPRMGYVQIKFLESVKTTHYIPEFYIKDNDGNLRKEFFLLCFTGLGDDTSQYFLTSNTIDSDFKIVDKNGFKNYSVSGTKLMGSRKYLIQSKVNTLNRIESHLKLADYNSNRIFISNLTNNSNIDTSAIMVEYLEPIPTSEGYHIPSEFKSLKDNALEAMSQLEDWHHTLQSFVQEIDPLKATSIISKLYAELTSGYYGGWGRDVAQNIFKESIYYAVKNHKEMESSLSQDGVLDEYIKLKEIIKKSIIEFICTKLPISISQIHRIQVCLNLDSLQLIQITHDLIESSEYFDKDKKTNKIDALPQYCGFKRLDQSSFEYYWHAGKLIDKFESMDEIKSHYENYDFYIYNDIMQKIYEFKYYDVI